MGGVSTAISKAKYFCCNCMSPARYSCISTTMKHTLLSKSILFDTALSTWAVYQPRSAKQSTCGAAVYHQRDLDAYQQQSKLTAKALGDTAVWTSAVYQPRLLTQTHLWRSCMSPAPCSCISTAIKKESKSPSGRHSHVDRGGINRNQQNNTYLAQVYVTRAVYQPRSAKRKNVSEMYFNSIRKCWRKHFWTTQPCRPVRYVNCNQKRESISCAAVYHQRGVAVYQQPSKSKAKALLDDTAISTWAVSQPRTAKQNKT